MLEEYHEALMAIPRVMINELEKIKIAYFNTATFKSAQSASNFYSFPELHYKAFNELDLDEPFAKVEEINKYIKNYLKVSNLMD